MSIVSFLTSWKAPKVPQRVVNKTWKAGMWVMCQNKPAIIAKLEDPVEIHFTDAITGEYAGTEFVPLSSLRQARHMEIPVARQNISAEYAKELGYGA